MSLFNLPIIADSNCCKLIYCYPKSKKKRIRKKWKKYRFKRIPSKEALIFGNRIVCHPIIYEQLKNAMKSAENTRVEF